jgi:hypothetical protein
MPEAERDAMREVVRKLERFGDHLPAPHSSAVRSADRLRELRPRGGHSPWRALYRRIGPRMWVGAFGPEAGHDERGFDGACRRAEQRLDRVEKGLDH